MSQNTHIFCEFEKMLDGYIYDYLVKRNLHGVAQAFVTEGNVSTDPVAIDSRDGFLLEWWRTFWDTFAASTNFNHNESDTQLANAGEVQGLHLQMQMQQIFYQGLAQEQPQPEMENFDSAAMMQQMMSDPSAQLVDTSYTSMLESQILQDVLGDIQPVQNLNQQLPLSAHLAQHDSLMGSAQSSDQLQQQQPFMVQAQENLISPSMGSAQSSDQLQQQQPFMVQAQENLISPSMGSAQSSDQLQQQQPFMVQAQENLISPSMGSAQSSDQLQQQQPFMVQAQENLISPSMGSAQSSDQLQQQQPFMVQAQENLISPSMGSAQSSDQLQQQQPFMVQAQQNLISPSMGSAQSSDQLQQQQPFMVQAQQNLISPSANHWESGMLVNNPNVMPHGDTDMALSDSNCISGNIQPVQNLNEQLPLSAHLLQHDYLAGSLQSSNQLQQQQPFMVKAQQDMILPSANHWESEMLLNNPNVIPLGDMDMTQLKRNPQQYYTEQLQLWDSYHLQPDKLTVPAAIYRGNEQVPRGQIGGKNKQVMSSLRSSFGRDSMDFLGDFTFVEAHALPPRSTSEVECCDFSYDGKLLATGGRDNKVVLWCTKSYSMQYTLAEHTECVTCVRFSRAIMSKRLATASADRTVKVWSADNPGSSIRTFEGHSGTVLSVEFYTGDEDSVWSSDESEIRSWSITNGECTRNFKVGGEGGATRLRFQPNVLGEGEKLLAAAQGNVVIMLSVREGGERQWCNLRNGQKEKVEWICWVPGQKHLCLASLTSAIITVWRIESNRTGVSCIGNVISRRSKFHTCAPHPHYHVSTVLVIGCQEGLEFWNVNHNKKMSGRTEEGEISAMAVSYGHFATVSRDKYVKLWK